MFFHVASFPQYGKLSKQKLEELRQGTRFDVDPSKRDPADFALWKEAKPGEPSWVSPWGEGRPGWHIECSAMSLKYLGAAFDFHGGGNDLIFPHHENEIAQSEAATDKELARYWVHNGMVNFKDAKMSKSIGNVISVKELVKRYPRAYSAFTCFLHITVPVWSFMTVNWTKCGGLEPSERCGAQPGERSPPCGPRGVE